VFTFARVDLLAPICFGRSLRFDRSLEAKVDEIRLSWCT